MLKLGEGSSGTSGVPEQRRPDYVGLSGQRPDGQGNNILLVDSTPLVDVYLPLESASGDCRSLGIYQMSKDLYSIPEG